MKIKVELIYQMMEEGNNIFHILNIWWRIIFHTSFGSLNSSVYFTPNSSAIWNNTFNPGWVVFEHHLLTVTGDTPNCSASHTPVRFCSTSTTLILFKSLTSIFNELNFMQRNKKCWISANFVDYYNTRAHNIIYYCNLNITIILINVHNRPLISG